jgi:hypothetical protein
MLQIVGGITQVVYLVPPMIYNILGEEDSCDITQRVYLVPPMIDNIPGEQDTCFITHTETACVM